MVRYNVACGLTFRNSDLEGALDLLEQYFERIDSPGQIRHAEIDPDMDSLRDDPRFKSMLAERKAEAGDGGADGQSYKHILVTSKALPHIGSPPSWRTAWRKFF